ncbi:MAG: chromosomal replication initiator protein DnaA [Bryobacterales bacterium]|nr:chromosomal replication initiator protein DnaA [Bryobacterales bacterium]
MNVWDLVKKQLQARLSGESFQNWVVGTAFHSIERDVLRVTVPNDETRQWLESEYSSLIHSLIRDLGINLQGVRYDINSLPSTRADALREMENGAREYEFDSSPCQLNPKFTFGSFVVGTCNQFAHAAARAVASSPSRAYNPLFIYGGVGMGKTHLMHAIGRALTDNYGTLRVVYTSSERFMNEMITCIRLDRMLHFHKFYRSADVLLVDDIQTLGAKERTQEEFFHTFNDLYEHQKQIVISSDSPPKEIPGLVERLRSRFEWGLMVDILPPDLETKMAILDKKAEAEGITLPEDVRTFLATKTKSNVRELEGGLIKLIAYSSLTGTPISVSMAQQALKHLIHSHERRISIEAIQKAVAEKLNLRPGQLKEKSNTRKIAFPRQIAMYLVKELTTASLPEIGRAFGGKHHTTVIHSIKKIEAQRQKDPDLNRLLHNLLDSLQ